MMVPKMVGSRVADKGTLGALQISVGPTNTEDIAEIRGPGDGGLRQMMEQR